MLPASYYETMGHCLAYVSRDGPRPDLLQGSRLGDNPRGVPRCPPCNMCWTWGVPTWQWAPRLPAPTWRSVLLACHGVVVVSLCHYERPVIRSIVRSRCAAACGGRSRVAAAPIDRARAPSVARPPVVYGRPARQDQAPPAECGPIESYESHDTGGDEKTKGLTRRGCCHPASYLG